MASDATIKFSGGIFGSPVSETPTGGPKSLAPGRWAVGVGSIETSDVGSCNTPCGSPFFPSWLNIDCVTQFDVPPNTMHIALNVEFGPSCGINIELEPPPAPPTKPMPVPAWTPPDGGILDDCHYRQALLHIDPDGRPWFEEVETGNRIETVEYEGWQAVPGDTGRLIPPEGGAGIRVWNIGQLTCVFEATGVDWVGGPYQAWDPWIAALGPDAAYVGQQILQLERNNDGGPPPTAVTLSSSRYEHVDRAVLRSLDDEIREGGKDRWSTVTPEFFLGDRPTLEQAIGTKSSIGFPDGDWEMTPDPTTGWRARQIREFKTPAGHTVSVLDRTLLVWQTCSGFSLPRGPLVTAAPGLPPFLDPETGLLTTYFDDPVTGLTLLALDYTDPVCAAIPGSRALVDGG